MSYSTDTRHLRLSLVDTDDGLEILGAEITEMWDGRSTEIATQIVNMMEPDEGPEAIAEFLEMAAQTVLTRAEARAREHLRAVPPLADQD